MPGLLRSLAKDPQKLERGSLAGVIYSIDPNTVGRGNTASNTQSPL